MEYVLMYTLVPILIISYELEVLFNAKKHWYSSYVLRSKHFSPERKREELNENQTGCLVNMIYLVWVSFGLFTSQWYLFAILLVLSFVPKYLLSLKEGILATKLDAILSIILIIMIMFNGISRGLIEST